MENIFKRIYHQIYCYVFADRIIGKYPQIKAKENRVNPLAELEKREKISK